MTELALHLAGGTVRDDQALARRFGVGGQWRHSTPDAWREAGLSAGLVQRLSGQASLKGAELEARRCQELGIRLVSRRDESYPEVLGQLHRPPLVLAVRGRWPPDPQTLAIVGARAATPSGRQIAASFATRAASLGVAVISGLARGVDRWALMATVEAQGWALGVLGCGIDVAYPRENRALQDRMARSGTVISEFPLGQRPDRWTFPRRNRIIAALSKAVLVVEAGQRSGALITASHALELGREVWAVPGPIDAELSVGCNRLILDGALPAISVDLLGEFLGFSAAARPCGPPAERDPLLAALGHSSLSVDELARAAGLDAQEAASRLLALQLEGAVQRLDGGLYIRRQ